MSNLKAAAVQFESRPGDKEHNLEKVRELAGKAAQAGAELVIFPECCITGYWHLRKLSREELLKLAEPVCTGPSCQALSEISKETRMAIGAGLVEVSPEGKLYNAYVVATPGGEFFRHRKIHCFVSRYMESGSEFNVFEIKPGWKACVLTCYDNNLGENVRIAALKGADVILAPHQTGGCDLKNPHAMGLVDRKKWDERDKNPAAIAEELKGPKGRGWLMRWLPARAHDNGVFLVFSNGVGIDDDEIRTGNSMILDPYGRVLAETWKAGEDVVTAELDRELFKNCTGRRWIRTRRPELYGPLAEKTGREEAVREVRFKEID